MEYTTNFQLNLPEYTDAVDIKKLNENFIKIDDHMGLYFLSDDGVHGLRYNATSNQLEYCVIKVNDNQETILEWLPAAELVNAVSTHNTDASAHTDIRNLANGAKTTADNALPKSGGTMTGEIILSGNPSDENHAVNKKYVDDAVSNMDNILKNYVANLIGGVEEVLTEADTFLGGD